MSFNPINDNPLNDGGLRHAILIWYDPERDAVDIERGSLHWAEVRGIIASAHEFLREDYMRQCFSEEEEAE